MVAPWATPGQLAFLNAHVPAYENAQELNATSAFLQLFKQKFYTHFESSTSECTSLETRIPVWFNNHSGARANKSAKASRNLEKSIDRLLDTGTDRKPRQKLQPIQAYSTLYWNRLRDIIEPLWHAAQAADPNLKPKHHLAFRNKMLAQLYEQEPESVRRQVEEYRNMQAMTSTKKVICQKEEILPGEEQLPADEKERRKNAREIQVQINSVQHVVRALLRKLEEKTGLVFCCLAGGAEPARNGRTVVFSIGSGRTYNGNKTFSMFDPRFHTVVVPIFHEFVHVCISPEYRDRIALDDSIVGISSTVQSVSDDHSHDAFGRSDYGTAIPSSSTASNATSTAAPTAAYPSYPQLLSRDSYNVTHPVATTPSLLPPAHISNSAQAFQIGTNIRNRGRKRKRRLKLRNSSSQLTLDDFENLLSDDEQSEDSDDDLTVTGVGIRDMAPMDRARIFGLISFPPNPVKDRVGLSTGDTTEHALTNTGIQLVPVGFTSQSGPIVESQSDTSIAGTEERVTQLQPQFPTHPTHLPESPSCVTPWSMLHLAHLSRIPEASIETGNDSDAENIRPPGVEEPPAVWRESSIRPPFMPLHSGIMDPPVDTVTIMEGSEPPTDRQELPIRPLLTPPHFNFAVSSSDTLAATEGTEETPAAPKDSSTHNPLTPRHLGIVDPLVDAAPGTEGTNEPPTAQRGSPIRPLLTPLHLDFVDPSSGTSTAKEGTEETPVVQKDSQICPPPGTETDMGVDGRVSTPGQPTIPQPMPTTPVLAHPEDIEAGPPSPSSPLSPIGASRSPSPTSSARATIECTLDEEQRARGKLLDQIDLSGLPEWAAKAHAALTQGTKNLNMAMRCVLADWVWLESTFAAQGQTANLKARNRPGEMTQWIKDQRKVEKTPTIKNMEIFATAWEAWYIDNMPKWRSLNGKSLASLSFDIPNNERWEEIGKGGKGGIFLLVISLHWWNIATLSARAKHRLRFCSALRDSAWLLQNIRSSLECGSGRRQLRPSTRLGGSSTFLRRTGDADNATAKRTVRKRR